MTERRVDMVECEPGRVGRVPGSIQSIQRAAAVLQLATRLPRWAVQTAAACGVAGIAGAFSLTVLVPLV